VIFSDAQEVAYLQKCLDTAQLVLAGQQKVLSACLDLHTRFSTTGDSSKSCRCDVVDTGTHLKEDLQHSSEVFGLLATKAIKAGHLVRTLHRQLLIKTDWCQLSSLLTARSQNALHRPLYTIQASSTALETASDHTRQSTSHLLRLTQESHRDSRSIKALSQLASMYLPASLVAAIFSTDIISWKTSMEVVPAGTSERGSSQAVGIYFAVTVPLLLVTLLYILWLEKGGMCRRRGALTGSP
jgi:hypothetical protein